MNFQIGPDFSVGSSLRLQEGTFTVVKIPISFTEAHRSHRPGEFLLKQSSLDSIPNLEDHVGWLKKVVGPGYRNYVAYVTINSTGYILCKNHDLAQEIYGRIPTLLKLARKSGNSSDGTVSSSSHVPHFVDPEWWDSVCQERGGVPSQDHEEMDIGDYRYLENS